MSLKTTMLTTMMLASLMGEELGIKLNTKPRNCIDVPLDIRDDWEKDKKESLYLWVQTAFDCKIYGLFKCNSGEYIAFKKGETLYTVTQHGSSFRYASLRPIPKGQYKNVKSITFEKEQENEEL